MTPQERAEFSASAREAMAFLRWFSPAERVARKYPDLPRIEDWEVAKHLSGYDGFDPVLLARSFRHKRWVKLGVPDGLAFDAALEAERRPTQAEIDDWYQGRLQ